jgi:hypothetical protein
MRLTKSAANCFVDRVGRCSNPATFVAQSWGCLQVTKGCNINGKVANTWAVPDWAEGRSERIEIPLTPRQLQRWNQWPEILSECLDAANPHVAVVRKTLAETKPGPKFAAAVQKLTEKGERDAVKKYRKQPEKINVTRDGDVQSNVSRLPESTRSVLQIDGLDAVEFDIKSAHVCLLGMFYTGEIGRDWLTEKKRFCDEAKQGFSAIYGAEKKWKIKFLSALNQSTRVAVHASDGYREFERMFPLLADELARLRGRDGKQLGRKLRVTLAEIIKIALIENGKDGIKSIPVIDSMVIAKPEDFAARHRAEFRTAWRLAEPITRLTGAPITIVGSDGESYCFHL